MSRLKNRVADQADQRAGELDHGKGQDDQPATLPETPAMDNGRAGRLAPRPHEDAGHDPPQRPLPIHQEERPTAKIRTFEDLVARTGSNVTLACDTEYKGPHTLTIQFAARLGDAIVVQVYSSPAIPVQSNARRLRKLLQPEISDHCRRVIIRPERLIAADLSPARVLADLFGIRGVETLGSVAEDNQELDGTLTVTLVGHYWPADFFRVFGRDFFITLLIHQVLGGQVVIQGNKLMSFKEARGRRCGNPVLDHAWTGGDRLYAIRVSYFDTRLTFGSSSLDDLAKTFVGMGKLEGFGEDEKADMLLTFRRERKRAYAYAITDAILTLLVHERMAAVNREMYEALGFQGDQPGLRPTLGSRVSEMVVKCIARDAEGAASLCRKSKALASGETGEVSPGKVKALLRKGSGDYIAQERLSVFGEQTGQTHGGLLFSRSPTTFFHAAPGMFRDVDLSGCYARDDVDVITVPAACPGRNFIGGENLFDFLCFGMYRGYFCLDQLAYDPQLTLRACTDPCWQPSGDRDYAVGFGVDEHNERLPTPWWMGSACDPGPVQSDLRHFKGAIWVT